MSETGANATTTLHNEEWCSEKDYSLLKAVKLSVRKAEADDIKVIQIKMSQQGQSYESLLIEVLNESWSQFCKNEKDRYQTFWNEKLQVIRGNKLPKILKEILEAKKNFQTTVVQRNEAVDQTLANSNEDVKNLCYLLNTLKDYEEEYCKEREQLIGQYKSIYPIYDISLICRENIVSGLSSLSNKVAQDYCHVSSIASLIIQEKLPNVGRHETIDRTPMATEGESSLRFKLNSCCQGCRCVLVILQTVLTLTCLTNSERSLFQRHLAHVQMKIDKYEACYIYILVRAYLNGKDVNYDDEKVKDFVDKCEQSFMLDDAMAIRRFLVAITALHFNRECQCTILRDTIKQYRRLSTSNDTIVEEAINILEKQNIKMCKSAEPFPHESIGLIPKEERSEQKSTACWYNRKNYLRISGNSKVKFPIYIHKSEIILLIKLIRDQFKFDFDGQYEAETALNLPHEPLSSLVVYLSKALQNTNNVQGQLWSAQQIIQLDDKDYYVRLPNVKESYHDLKQIIFTRLIHNSNQYIEWFRTIINQSGKNINGEDDFVLFAHAKAVSESARNLSTWMINLMCLDLIERGIRLDEKYNTDKSNRKREDAEKYSPWHLFFDYHPMAGGSFHKKNVAGERNKNQDEIENSEVYIVMNWLCNFWLGNKSTSVPMVNKSTSVPMVNKSTSVPMVNKSTSVTMVNDSDIDLVELEKNGRTDLEAAEKNGRTDLEAAKKIGRTNLEAAERYARTCILNALYYRTYSIAPWDCNHFEDVLLLQSSSPLVRQPRRILGQMFFDNEPLCIKTDDSLNSNDPPDEEQLEKNKRLESDKDTDREEVRGQSIKRFERLIKKSTHGNGLREFYQNKLQQLKQRRPITAKEN